MIHNLICSIHLAHLRPTLVSTDVKDAAMKLPQMQATRCRLKITTNMPLHKVPYDGVCLCIRNLEFSLELNPRLHTNQ